MLVKKIVSGGQTGADRGALDAAIEAGVEHGGWVPRGRRAEDGLVPDRYRMTETECEEYPVRTERNVIDSDGTLIITNGPFDGGTGLTAKLAEQHAKPLFIVRQAWTVETVERVSQWITENGIVTLNVAGPRESRSHGAYEFALEFLREVLGSSKFKVQGSKF